MQRSVRKLGVVLDIVQSVDMGISYAFDDLVFLEHNALLLQFGEDADTVLIHVNEEAEEAEAQTAIRDLQRAAAAHEMQFVEGTRYTLAQADDENIRIEFLPTAT